MARIIPDNDHRNFNKPSIWVPLFEITLDTQTLYYTPNQEEIVADGHTYVPFPVMLDEIRDDGKGEICTVQLTISNIDGILGGYIKQSGSVDGQSIVFKQYSVEKDDIVYQENLEILKCGPITDEAIVLELGTFNPFMVSLLQEKYLTDFCWNRYKGKGCWIKKIAGTYAQPGGFTAGAPDTCNHTLADCERHTNVLRFNSFPGIPGSAYVGGGGFV